MFHAVDRRLPIVTDKVVSIQVVPSSVKSVESFLHPIRVKHRNNDNLKVLANDLSLFRLTGQEMQDSLHSPACRSFPRVDPTADQNHGLLNIFFCGLEMFFRKEDRVAVLSDFLFPLGDS